MGMIIEGFLSLIFPNNQNIFSDPCLHCESNQRHLKVEDNLSSFIPRIYSIHVYGMNKKYKISVYFFSLGLRECFFPDHSVS